MGPVPDRSSLQTNSIILIVVGFLCGGMLPTIFGIIALVQMDTDPYSSKKMNKIGWIIMIVSWILAIVGIIIYALFMVLVVGGVLFTTV